jgi:tRNA dimethylallyltransferase
MMEKDKIVFIVGTNASGKSGLALNLAKKNNAEIISADSRQIYKGYDLCSGKVTKEEQSEVKHHLIDILNVGEYFSTSAFQELAYTAINDILSRNKKVIIVGGTGLYIDSIVKGFDLSSETPNFQLRQYLESLTNSQLVGIIKEKEKIIPDYLDLNNRVRLLRAVEIISAGKSLRDTRKNNPKFDCIEIGLTWERPVLRNRIKQRLHERLSKGMVDEIREGLANGISYDIFYKLGLEYRYIVRYLNNEFDNYEEFCEKLAIAIGQFSKRQMVWFKKNQNINWLNTKEDYLQEAENIINNFYS